MGEKKRIKGHGGLNQERQRHPRDQNKLTIENQIKLAINLLKKIGSAHKEQMLAEEFCVNTFYFYCLTE